MKTLRTWSSVALLVLSLTALAFGQERTGSIEGTVSDVSGARVPGATVKVEGASFNRTVTTGNDGFFRVLQVPPGAYKVTVLAGNFRPAVAEAVAVVLGQGTPLEFSLTAGPVQEQVVITSDDVAAVDTTASKIQTNITAQNVELLPKGTNFTSVLTVAPAVRNEPLSSGFQIDGASGAENTFIIDGQEVTNFRTGQLNSNNNIPFQFVQEIQIKSNGFEAEYGGATGGVINVVTKRGANEWHGDFGIQFEFDALSAAQVRTTNAEGTGIGYASFQGRRPNVLAANSATLRYLQPGGDDFSNYFPTGTLSGPIIKDRVWFLANYTPQFFRTERNFVYPNGETQNYVSKVRRDYGFLRLDGQVSEKVNLYGTYTYNPVRVHGLLDDLTNTAVPQSTLYGQTLRGSDLLKEQGGRQPASTVSFGGVWTPTSSLVINARGGRSYLNEKILAYGVPRQTRFLCSASGLTPPPGAGCASGFSSFPNNFQYNKDVSVRWTFDGDGSFLVNNLGGRHQFKVGYQLNDINNQVDQGYFDEGVIVLLYGRTFQGIGGAAGNIGYGYLQRFGTIGEAGSRNQAIYFQDSWQPFSRLTLNLGFRMERENVPTFASNAPGIEFGFGKKPAPRIGGSFDVLGNGKMKLFASYGWFYDRFKYELPRGSFGGDKYLRDYFPILASSPAYGTYIRDYALKNSQLQLDFRVPSNSPEDNRIDPDLDAARQSEFTVGTEYEFGRNFVLGARFTHKQIDRAIEDVGIFDAGGNELYFIANPGYGVVGKPLLAGVPATPKAERKYNAFEIRLDKRFSANYYFNANYTYSRLEGNYSGLASSDERGRSSPNVNRFFDLPFLGFTADGRPDNGRLATDRPHVFKLAGGYNLDWNRFGLSGNGTDLTLFFTAQSGTPLTTLYTLYSVDSAILNGRGDLGRTPSFTQTDFAFSHKIKLGSNDRYTVAFDFNVLNLFNENNVLDQFTRITPFNFTGANFGGISETATIQKIFAGGLSSNVNSLITSGGQFAKDARYLVPQTFQTGREIRSGFRFQF